MMHDTCGLCAHCGLIEGVAPNGEPIRIWVCRAEPPRASGDPHAVVAHAGMAAVARGVWPAVDPDTDSCARFVEGSFS